MSRLHQNMFTLTYFKIITFNSHQRKMLSTLSFEISHLCIIILKAFLRNEFLDDLTGSKYYIKLWLCWIIIDVVVFSLCMFINWKFFLFFYVSVIRVVCVNYIQQTVFVQPSFQPIQHHWFLKQLFLCFHYNQLFGMHTTQSKNNPVQISKTISESTAVGATSSSPIRVRIVFQVLPINFALRHILLHLLWQVHCRH